jgi:hypothetical protein
MGEDNQPKHRQASRDIGRKKARRGTYERLLIICEGEKTEPQYLNEIKNELKLRTAHVQVFQSPLGTTPLQVVNGAEQIFLSGDQARDIRPREFDRIFAVFDRDSHLNFFDALARANALNNHYENDDGEPTPFYAIPSLPCFELWLLFHYQNVQAPIHRQDVYRLLGQYLPGYQKGARGYWASTKHKLDDAIQRSEAQLTLARPRDGQGPSTTMHELVNYLLHLRD